LPSSTEWAKTAIRKSLSEWHGGVLLAEDVNGCCNFEDLAKGAGPAVDRAIPDKVATTYQTHTGRENREDGSFEGTCAQLSRRTER